MIFVGRRIKIHHHETCAHGKAGIVWETRNQSSQFVGLRRRLIVQSSVGKWRKQPLERWTVSTFMILSFYNCVDTRLESGHCGWIACHRECLQIYDWKPQKTVSELQPTLTPPTFHFSCTQPQNLTTRIVIRACRTWRTFPDSSFTSVFSSIHSNVSFKVSSYCICRSLHQSSKTSIQLSWFPSSTAVRLHFERKLISPHFLLPFFLTLMTCWCKTDFFLG